MRQKALGITLFVVVCAFLICIFIYRNRTIFEDSEKNNRTSNAEMVLEEATGSVSGQVDDTGLQELEPLEVHFIYIGQGDATLVKCGKDIMLIDAGSAIEGPYLQYYLKKQGIKSIKYLVGTHADADHIGGLSAIIRKYDCEQIFLSENIGEIQNTYQATLDAMDRKGYVRSPIQIGKEFSLGSSRFSLLGPISEGDQDNNQSIVIRIQNGAKSFLFTGDAQEAEETELIKSGQMLKADVYKAGHHGSKTSTTLRFLKAVEPSVCVISCGVDNAYGMPHREVIDLLKSKRIEIYRTDLLGNIVAITDGRNVDWTFTEPMQIPIVDEFAYVGNIKNDKLHRTNCKKAPAKQNQVLFDTLEEAKVAGFKQINQCNVCKPFLDESDPDAD